MYICRLISLYFLIYLILPADAKEIDIMSHVSDKEKSLKEVVRVDFSNYRYDYKYKFKEETVRIDVYYECLCPFCRKFFNSELVPVMQKLSPQLDIHTFPYGNAKTVKQDNHYEFKCQHGAIECYGNKLHACANNILQNVNESVLFDACLMKYTQKNYGSDDAAADVCGKSMNIDPEPMKACAKSEKGTELLKYYGDLSKKVNFPYVPYILINGVLSDGTNFMKVVCAAFKNLPPPCV